MKICSKCKEEKAPEEFSKQKDKKDGRRSHCKKCVAQYRKKHKEIRINLPGFTKDDYKLFLNAQEGKCAICGGHWSDSNRLLCVDHDHETNKFRGLLCNNCNCMLGFAKDNIIIFENAIAYLRKVRSI